MKKVALMLCLLFLCGISFSQIYTPVTPTVYGQNVNRIKPFLVQHLPEKDSVTNTGDTTTQIFYRKLDSSVWIYSRALGFKKISFSGGSGVTPTWQQTLTAGSVLTTNNTISSPTGRRFTMQTTGIGTSRSVYTLVDTSLIQMSVTDVSNANAYFDLSSGGGIQLISTDATGAITPQLLLGNGVATLYSTNGTNVNLLEAGSGTAGILIQSNLGGYRLPRTTPALGQTIFEADGSGNLIWATPASGSSLFPLTGTGTATGNVVGDLDNHSLTIDNATLYLNGRFNQRGNFSMVSYPDSMHLESSGGTLYLGDEHTNRSTIRLNQNAGERNIKFLAGGSERVRIDSNGYVGIGTSVPTHTLTLGDTINSAKYWQRIGEQEDAFTIYAPAIGFNIMRIDGLNNNVLFGESGGAKVGIGTATSDSLLSVNGGVDITGGLKLGNAISLNGSYGTSGQVLTSAAGGINTWTTPTTGTVTSIATGLGLLGGTINSSGTLLVDTSSVSILSRQRAAFTYAPLASPTFTPSAVNTAAITSSGYSLTGTSTQPLLDLSGTWNTSGGATLIKANVTNTASGASALLMDLQVGGVSQFKVDKGGIITAVGSINAFNVSATGLVQSATASSVGHNSSNKFTATSNGFENLTASSGAANSAVLSVGALRTGYVAKTANYTATAFDEVIACSTNAFTVTLPTAVGCAGQKYWITNSTAANTITIGTTSSQTFANVTATPTTLSLVALGSVGVVSDGANWLQLK